MGKQSKTWYMILDVNGNSIYNKDIKVSLPLPQKKGEWMVAEEGKGIVLVANPNSSMGTDNRPFIAEFSGELVLNDPHIPLAKRVRLLREATNLDLKKFGIHRVIVPKNS